MAKQEVKPFKPVVYVSRAKAFNIWVMLPEKEAETEILFQSNGTVGIYTAKTQEEVEVIEKNPHYGGEFRRLGEGESLNGSGAKVIAGSRRVIEEVLKPEPIDPRVQQSIIDSNQAAKRPAGMRDE